MKFLLLLLVLPLLVLGGFSKHALAAGPFDEICNSPEVQAQAQADKPSACSANNQDPLTGTGGVILKAAKLISFITGVASVIIILVGGLKYITANGDSNSVNSAKNTILYALVGLIVSLLAQGIIVFIINRVKVG